MNDASTLAMLRLTLVRGLGPTLIRRLLEGFGSAEAALDASVEALASVRGISLAKACQCREDFSRDDLVGAELDLVARHGVALLGREDASYPALLKLIHDPPPLLYVKGSLHADDALALAIVGARKCTRYGREMADRLAAGCGGSLCIVSGGAYGIDAAAHRAALRVGSRTISVLGSGLADPYPKPHIELFDQIVASGGVVMSELPMTASPQPGNFPSRNRIISGLALGTLVVEAAVRSGAMITARLAAEDHGREVMAVPGPADSPMSEGCHKMIRDGWATLVTRPSDIFEALGETGQLLKATAEQAAATGTSTPPPVASNPLDVQLSDSQRKIIAALERPLPINEIARSTSLAMHQIQADLTMLEIRGILVREAGAYATTRPPETCPGVSIKPPGASPEVPSKIFPQIPGAGESSVQIPIGDAS